MSIKDSFFQLASGTLQEWEPFTEPCIYFLTYKGQIVYIGQTIMLPGAIARHAGPRTRSSKPGVRTWLYEEPKRFDRVFFKACPRKRLDSTEEALIVYFQPELNKKVHRRKIPHEQAARIARRFLSS